MTFPGAGATVYYNEAGEPLGWDYPSDPTEYYYDDYDRLDDYFEYDNPCDFCGEEIEDTDEQVKIRREVGRWKGQVDYVHSRCAEVCDWPGARIAPDGTIIEIVEESE